MTAELIDGKAFAAGLRARIAAEVAAMKAAHGITPGLAVVLVGDDPASGVYVRAKGKATAEVGMEGFAHRLPADTAEADLLALIARLNDDPAVNGILVQLPLPGHMDEAAVINAIAPEKDVDGFTVLNAGRLATGQKAMVPCTPLGCLMLLRDRLGSLAGRDALVIGRSNIVGKPMAQLLTADSATVTVAHSRTRDLGRADDHRLPAGQHPDRNGPRPRPGRPAGADALRRVTSVGASAPARLTPRRISSRCVRSASPSPPSAAPRPRTPRG